ncbi:MAG: IS1182 family transposase [Crocinitomicaceae bacterium]|nr:IS1182 family transposase [Crocinitomicaceae bacterium]
MQGKKDYQEQLFTSFQLSNHIPKENFYRLLSEHLDLYFVRSLTKEHYGTCGQKSMDPVVFYKLSLVGYLENIISDRKLIDHCSMRMDILFFLGYDIDEPLPWHSTISRTRQLFPDDLFEKVFTEVLTMCIEKGMVSGHTQVIDSAPVKANASMDSLELKVPEDELDDHIRKIRRSNSEDEPRRKSKEDKSDTDQRSLKASESDLNAIKNRNKNWQDKSGDRPGHNLKQAKYTSNKTHYSPTDPDARISVKPGKSRKLNYLSQMSVDTANHVITDIGADFADQKDSQHLQKITLRLKERLRKEGLLMHNVLADAGYSSGENYAFFEELGLQSYIPPHGKYKGGPRGFTYHKEADASASRSYWECSQGKRAEFRKTHENKGIKKNQYATKRADCRDCPIKTACIGKSHQKRIDITYYKEEYDRGIARLKSKQGKRFKFLRSSTVEPVFGSLTQFFGMRKVNTIGIKQANKVMLMAGAAYNLKKYLKFVGKTAKSKAEEVKSALASIFDQITAREIRFEPLIY